MFTFTPRRNGLLRAAPLALIAALSLAACGNSYNGGMTYNMPTGGAGSKLFAADSVHMMIGSLVNPDPPTGPLTVNRMIGGMFNYAGLSNNIGSLALDPTLDYLYVGNGTSILVFFSASMANGDIFSSRTITSSPAFSNTGSMFLDTTHDILYVGDNLAGVRVFTGISGLATGSHAPDHSVTGNFGTAFLIRGVAVDTRANNILYVSNDITSPTSSHRISVFNNASTVTTAAPIRTITPTVSTVNQPVGGISLDATHDVLYVAPGSSGNGIMVFSPASAADGLIPPAKTLMITSAPGILSVLVDPVNDRLYAVGSNGHIYLIETVSMLSSGNAAAKDASLSNGGMLTAVAVSP